MDEEQLHSKAILACREHEHKYNEMSASLERAPSWQEWAEAMGAEDLEAFKELVTQGRKSRAIFEQCNLRLVAKMAYKYIDRGLELEVGVYVFVGFTIHQTQ